MYDSLLSAYIILMVRDNDHFSDKIHVLMECRKVAMKEKKIAPHRIKLVFIVFHCLPFSLI